MFQRINSRPSRSVRLIALVSACAVAMGLLAACSQNGNETTDPSTLTPTETTTLTSPVDDPTVIPEVNLNLAKNEDLAKLVPDDIRERGKLIVVMSANSPPAEQLDKDGNIEGYDPDFSLAMASLLGLERQIEVVSFETIITGLAAKRYDIAMSNMGIRQARMDQIDMLSYVQVAFGFIALESSTLVVTSTDEFNLPELCGHSVAAVAGSGEETILTDQGDKCKAAGQAGVDLQVYKDTPSMVQAIQSGRVEMAMENFNTASILAETPASKMKVISPPIPSHLTGIGFTKDSPLIPAIQGAMRELMSNGQYDAILQKWEVLDQKWICDAVLNPKPASPDAHPDPTSNDLPCVGQTRTRH